MKNNLSLLLFFYSVFAFSQTSPNFHDTKGNIEVNGAGQLQFTLPIAQTPGVRSVAPQFSLVYISGTGNGLAGYGWSIFGITSISRVGKTVEKYGEAKGIQLDYSDEYRFNGQRLILSSGEYGKDGAEYVTEKYSNVRIKSNIVA
ncbi:SpvB/TcaC N-terminal domain-containing protein [Chryseobacterium gossypii]|uniref:SpvB/TcaC N-terminal domain-containing protein n=1 Tax=Chryseobacterium gossypii TaxID=3231602 RepID=UPI0035254945